MPLPRLKRNLTTKTLWIYILTLLKEKPRYAYEIQKEIKKKFGFKIGKITSYVVLYRLEKSGYVEKKIEESGRRIRKYYQITKKGENLLDQGIKFLEEILEKIK